MAEDVLDRTFPISGDARLELSNIRGTVVVTAGSDDQIHILAVKHTETGDAENTNVNVEQRGEGYIHVETSYQVFTGWFSGRKPCRVDYYVKVPSRCSLKLSGVSSSIQVEGVQGKAKVRTVSGPISLTNLGGGLELDGVSGDIDVSHLDGELAFKTVSGDLQIRESNLQEVRGSTVSGNVTIQSPVRASYELRSVSGNARLVLPEGNACTVKKSSISGRLRTSKPANSSTAASSRTSGREQTLDIEGGGPVIRYSSISGDIFVDYTGEAEISGTRPENDKPEQKEPKQEEPERLEILELIESGQISVEEGIERLKSL
jgi:DUF4097 and DUF4098 domain-containing protein YvlB